MMAHENPEIDNNLGCADEVWQAMTSFANQAWESIANAGSAVLAVITDAGSRAWDGMSHFFRALYHSTITGIRWVGHNVLLPIAMTGLNILGYLVDKLLYGSPGLRPYLHDGIFSEDIPLEWRQKLKNNSGWDIYEHMHPWLDNGFGIFGLGFGFINIFSHCAAAVKSILPWSYNFLGNHGILGSRKKYQDDRHPLVKAIFGLLSAPVWVPLTFVTNSFDLICTLTKHIGLSIGSILPWSYNLLGNHGVLGPRQKYQDDRHPLIQAIFGLLSAPVWVPLTFVTNSFDLICTLTKQIGLSIKHILPWSYNFLGNHGVLGPRQKYQDDRHPLVQAIFGLLSAPVWVPLTFVTNSFDLICTLTKHIGLSIGSILPWSYNFLGNHGVLGPRQKYQDDRHPIIQAIFGLLSAPVWLPITLITNSFDLICTLTKHIGLSIGSILPWSYNFLGNHGILGPRQKYQDNRHPLVQAIFGLLSSPVWLPVTLITNSFDLICTLTKHIGLSIGSILPWSYNFLGNHGVLGPRKKYQDNRHPLVQAIFGLLSAPVWVPLTFVTNSFDLICTLTKHIGLSIRYLFPWSYNLLGNHGILGPRQKYQDDRHPLVQAIFGILSAPVWLPITLITNSFDIICTLTKHIGLSIGSILPWSYNFLGNHGVLGQRQKYQDDRHPLVQAIFGLLSSPVWLPATLITNSFDLICTLTKHIGLSIKHILPWSYNFLGNHGVLGSRQKYQDDRHPLVQAIFGLLSSPVWLPVTLITNSFDLICTLTKHIGLSIRYLFPWSYNLLGNHGVLGPRQKYQDDRHPLVQAIFGLLSAPVWVPLTLITNSFDLICTLTKHIGLSIGSILPWSYNFLGNHGVLGPRQKYQDDRHPLVQAIFGLLSSPVWLPVTLITNSFDLICTLTKQIGLSIGSILPWSYNFLGNHGVLGQRQKYQDDRHPLIQAIFGLLSSPVWLPVTLITNSFDLICTLTKHIGLSIGSILPWSYNLLGNHGVLGSRQKYQDDRHPLVQAIFGLLSSPVWLPVTFITNSFDLICTLTKHISLSISRILPWSYNLLGNHGILGPRQKYQDDRHPLIQAIFGLLSSPVWAPLTFVTNSFDLICTLTKHIGLSIGSILPWSYNLLGNHGVLGSRQKYQDDRHPLIQAIFGLLSSPVWLPVTLITNSFDLICTLTKHIGLSIKHILPWSYNFLGNHGVLGLRQKYQDDRHPLVQAIFGLLSAPVWAPLTFVTNSFDLICTLTKHIGLSIGSILPWSYNLLGNHGVLGPRQKYQDDRHPIVQAIFGLLSSPVWLPVTLITNSFDLICTLTKHIGLSIGSILPWSYNLLGNHGVLGSRQKYQDDRHPIVQAIFGLLSAPVWVPLTLITNSFDLICTLTKHISLSISRILPWSYNLLGNHGVLGPRQKYQDDRHPIVQAVFGILSAPVWGPVTAMTNSVDLVCSYFKNYKNTILMPIGFVLGVALAIPAFMARKFFKGLVNIGSTINDCLHNRPFDCGRFTKGLANVLTLGLFSAIKKVFKFCTGYTDRFGVGFQSPPNGFAITFAPTPYNRVQAKFRQAIHLATRGAFPGINDVPIFRPIMRVFYGMRHKVEDMVKAFHDAYLIYAKNLAEGHHEKTELAFSMHSFFGSDQFARVKANIINQLRPGEDKVLENVENYLRSAQLSV